MTVVAITGHRPNKIPNKDYVEFQLTLAYRDLKADKVIQGMADGVDLWAARMAYYSRIPFVAVRPWASHSSSESFQSMYSYALENADEVVVIDESVRFPGKSIYQRRNEWMVDNSDILIAVWDGSDSGTANTVSYAKTLHRPIWWIPPDPKRNGEIGWLNYTTV